MSAFSHKQTLKERAPNPLLLRLPLPHQLLGLGYLGRSHPLGNYIAVLDRLIAVLAGGYLEAALRYHFAPLA